jgi:uncharacterized protein YceK
MRTVLLFSLCCAFFSGCSTTRIKHATIESATFNTATWKSQAGVGETATIEATTAPKTDTNLTGL